MLFGAVPGVCLRPRLGRIGGWEADVDYRRIPVSVFLGFCLVRRYRRVGCFSGSGVVSVVLDLFSLGGAFLSRHYVSSFTEIES